MRAPKVTLCALAAIAAWDTSSAANATQTHTSSVYPQASGSTQPQSPKSSGPLSLGAATEIAPEVAQGPLPGGLSGALSETLLRALPKTLPRQPARLLDRNADAFPHRQALQQAKTARSQLNSSGQPRVPSHTRDAATVKEVKEADPAVRPILYSDRPDVTAAASNLALQLAESGEFERARGLLQMLPPDEQSAILAKIEAWQPPQPLTTPSATSEPSSTQRPEQPEAEPASAPQALLSRLMPRLLMLQALENRPLLSAPASAAASTAAPEPSWGTSGEPLPEAAASNAAEADSESSLITPEEPLLSETNGSSETVSESSSEASAEPLPEAVSSASSETASNAAFEGLAPTLSAVTLELPVQPPETPAAPTASSGQVGGSAGGAPAIALGQRPSVLEPAEVNQQAVRDSWTAPATIPEPPPLPDTLAYAPRPQNQSPSGMIFPLAVPAPMTSPFGWRTHPISGARRFHAGTDFGAPEGTPVVAALPGKVARSSWMGGYGLAIEIEHKDGTLDTFYAHLSQALVESGDWVEQGTVIGHVGTTGYSTGPHLHFEVRRLSAEGSVEVDPMVELGPAPTYANQTVSTAPEEPEPAAAEPVPSVQPSPEYSVARISEVKSLDSRISVAPVEPASSAAQPQASPAAQNISVAAASASPPAAAPQPIVPDRISTLKLEDLDRWSNLCRSQMASDQYAEALAACNRTIALQPANLDLWMMRGQILEKLGRPSEAAAVYSYVLQRQPQHAEAQRLRGLALLASDKLAKEKMTQP